VIDNPKFQSLFYSHFTSIITHYHTIQNMPNGHSHSGCARNGLTPQSIGTATSPSLLHD